MTDDEAIAELVAEGRVAWPTLRADPPLADVLRRKAGDKSIAELAGSLDPGELFLAAAVLAGDTAAPAAFEERYASWVESALARSNASRDELDEVRQLIRTRLLVPADGGVPRLVDYCGAGRLPGLLRVAALRALINLRAKHRPTEQLDDSLATRVAADLDPQHAQIKREEREVVVAAIRAAARALPGRSRSLLRLNLVDGLSIDELGRVFGIHRATAARQLARAREELIGSVRQRLVEHWGPEADALALVSSCLDITLGGALASGSSA